MDYSNRVRGIVTYEEISSQQLTRLKEFVHEGALLKKVGADSLFANWAIVDDLGFRISSPPRENSNLREEITEIVRFLNDNLEAKNIEVNINRYDDYSHYENFKLIDGKVVSAPVKIIKETGEYT